MKKVIAIIITIIMLFGATVCFADDIDLTQMTKDELVALQQRIAQEIKDNHTLSTKEENDVSSAAKQYIEALMKQEGASVSWAWVDYTYTKDWDYATVSTHFDIKDSSKKSTRYELLCGAYFENGEWNVRYVSLNDQVILDERDAIPDPRLNPNASAIPENTATPEPTTTTSPELTEVSTEFPTEAPTSEPEKDEMPTGLQHGELISIIENLDYDLVVVKAKISPSYSKKATVDQNYYNIETLVKKYGFERYGKVDYWAVADMTDGSEQKVVAFVVPHDTLVKLANSQIATNMLGDYVEDLWIHPSLR